MKKLLLFLSLLTVSAEFLAIPCPIPTPPQRPVTPPRPATPPAK